MEIKERGRGRREKREKVAGARKLVDGNYKYRLIIRLYS